MAALSTIPPPSSVQISGKNLFRQMPNTCSFPWKKQITTKRTMVSPARNSGEVSAETAADVGSETAVDETPREPTSLISALNVERALRGLPITDVDHYGRLGLPRGCSYDQVNTAYRDKIKELMDRGLDEEQLSKETELLKESYTILSSVEERRMYDWSLARSGIPDRYVWPFEVDITQTPTQEPPPPEPEDVGPTRLVGYFFLGWLVLGITLSVALNR